MRQTVWAWLTLVVLCCVLTVMYCSLNPFAPFADASVYYRAPGCAEHTGPYDAGPPCTYFPATSAGVTVTDLAKGGRMCTLAFGDAGVAAVRLESCDYNDRLPAGTALLLQRWQGRITAVFPRSGGQPIARTYDHPAVREVRSNVWLGIDVVLVSVTVVAVARYLIHGFSLGFTLRPLITGTFTARTAKAPTTVTQV